MVLGHQTAGLLGVIPKPGADLGEQFLHAAATNLQLSAGMGLVHSLAPNLSALERGLDLSASSKGMGLDPFSPARDPWVWQGVGEPGEGSRNVFEPDRIPSPLLMSSSKKGGEEPPASGSAPSSSETEPPWQYRTFKTLAKRLGVEIRTEEKGYPMTLETQKKVRARVMDLISRPAVAAWMNFSLKDLAPAWAASTISSTALTLSCVAALSLV